MLGLIKKYFRWLQKDNPTGEVTFYPELSDDGETTLKGVYIVGDLTGLPLLKTATQGGLNMVRKLPAPLRKENRSKIFETFEKEAKENTQNTEGEEQFYDLIIIGAGPAGLSAGIEAKKRGYKYVILEATNRDFGTIENFPKGKPMFYEPQDMQEDGPLTLKGETKEELLDHLHSIMKKQKLNVIYNQKVNRIEPLGNGINRIITDSGEEYISHKTILAIGKSGNHRRLNIEGENLAHVSNKLYDPMDFKNKDVLVVGGGDTAIESTILLAQHAKSVTLSYRKKEITRPKPDNVMHLKELEKAGKVNIILESHIEKITPEKVYINKKDEKGQRKTEEQKIDNVFIMIGTQLPYAFFEKSGIKIENRKTKITWWWLTFTIAFMNIVYFGKLSPALQSNSSFNEALSSIFQGNFIHIASKLLSWVSVLVLAISGIVVFFDLLKNWRKYFKTRWHYIKNGYFALVIILFLSAFFGNKYFAWNLGGKDPYFWYSFLYTTTIALFGLRRIVVNKKNYVTRQTISLVLIQAIPLFIIPNFILPWMNNLGLLSSWVIENIFLGGEWWRFVGFILAWPLFFWNIFTSEPSTFWLIVSLVQTFIIIPFIVIRWGKGAYCAWICSCGAMAETLGDEYRTLAPHGLKWKRLENLGQIILFSIFIVTILHMLGWNPNLSTALEGINNILRSGYQIFVDTLLAGTLGAGFYFFYSGRTWCRFACPLAALMHIYNKFAIWRILAHKKKCISCGLCTKACHMGIDVMSYAQKGLPMEDVECVNCSACINVCPTGVLSFGKYKKIWGKNISSSKRKH